MIKSIINWFNRRQRQGIIIPPTPSPLFIPLDPFDSSFLDHDWITLPEIHFGVISSAELIKVAFLIDLYDYETLGNIEYLTGSTRLERTRNSYLEYLKNESKDKAYYRKVLGAYEFYQT